MAEDPYDILGVARDADPAAIRKAYLALARKHHPDLNPGDKAAETAFKRVSAAADLLSDAEKRAAFDRGEIDAAGQPRPERPQYRDFAEGMSGRRYRPAGAGGGAASGHPAGGFGASEEELGDIFSSLFGDGRGTGPIKGRDERYGLTAGLLDAVRGATRRLTLPDGRAFDVRIPPGLEDGQTLRLRGQGAPGLNGGPSGDALIQVTLAEHPFFRREGSDIALDLPVSLKEAVLGARIEVPTPHGAVAMTVPRGSDSGTRLRLRGRGVPAHAGNEAGDLYVTLRVVIGIADTALETFLAQWAPEPSPDPRRDMMGGRMITIEALCVQVRGLCREDLQRWIERAWVRPDGEPGGYLFHDIDVARVRLIVELREQLQVDDEVLPIVLSLLDQLYEARRRMRRLRDALDQADHQAALGPLRQELLRQLIADQA